MQGFLTSKQRSAMREIVKRDGITLYQTMTQGGKPAITVEFDGKLTGDGQTRWDTMTVANWDILLKNAEALSAAFSEIHEGERRIREEAKAKARESLDTLKGILTRPAAIRAALEGEGYSPDIVTEVMKEQITKVA